MDMFLWWSECGVLKEKSLLPDCWCRRWAKTVPSELQKYCWIQGHVWIGPCSFSMCLVQNKRRAGQMWGESILVYTGNKLLSKARAGTLRNINGLWQLIFFFGWVQIATTRRLTVHFNPPSSCVLEISMRGVKIAVKNDDTKDPSKVSLTACEALLAALSTHPWRSPFSLSHFLQESTG